MGDVSEVNEDINEDIELGPTGSIRTTELPTLLGNSTSTATAAALWEQRLNQSKREMDHSGQMDHSGHSNGEASDLSRSFAVAYGEATLTFKDVTFSAKLHGGSKEQLILAPMSGHFSPGTLVALMGPSGCGKSTLLDILAEKKTAPYGGTVHFNGRPRDRLFRRMVAYVPQDDVMAAHMTVKEAVLFAGALKQEVPAKVTRAMCGKVADWRLQVLGLGGVADSLIGDDHVRGISGGQKKRLSLARGLTSGAHIIFCDEPTSGLSATDAEMCVHYMRHLAHKYGVTIIVAIHQPRIEVASQFDHLILLTSGPGRVVYNGPMDEASAHWERVGYPVPPHANPTDHFMDLITPGRRMSCQDVFLEYYERECKPALDELVSRELTTTRRTPLELLEMRRKVKMAYGYVPPVRNTPYGVPFQLQLWLVLKRQMILTIRDKQGAIAELLAAIVKAVVVGVAYLRIGSLDPRQQVAFFFMLCMSCSIDGLKQMPKLIGERTLMKMETSEAFYSEWAYIASFTLVSGAQWIITHSIFVTILFMMTGFPWQLYASVYFYSGLLSLTMDGLYMMVSAIAKDATSAIVLSVPFLMLFLLYNGFTTTRNSVPGFMCWAVNVSPVAYAIEQLTIEAQSFYQGTDRLQGWNDVVQLLGFKRETERAIGVTLGFCFGFRAIQVVCLKFLNNIQR